MEDGLPERLSDKSIPCILLCSDKNDTVVKMALPEDNSTILASKYQLYLPTAEQLIKEIDEVRQLAT